MSNEPGLTPLGKILSVLIIAGLIGLGGYVVLLKSKTQAPKPGEEAAAPGATATAVVEPQTETPRLPAAAAYVPKGNVVEIELSEYAGYAGLIAANGGLEPSEESFFFKKYGFKVQLRLSEAESWPALNSGKMAASATTADVLAAYGRQFQVVVPAQIGFSRGADGVVVTADIKRINALKGKVLATAQFTEADFFIRYLAQEAGLGVKMLRDLAAAPSPEAVNLVYCEDAFAAGDLFLEELKTGRNRLAGCVTWAPKTTDVVAQSAGKATLLTTNRNLLIVADILVVNRGFAEQQPKMVAGLVHGLMEGNRRVRDNSAAQLDVIAKAFKWDRAKTQHELEKVHLSNLPESLAFFSGAIDAAGSFGGIYQSAVYAYGKELIKDPADPARFLDLKHLQALEQGGEFASQQIAIAPIRTEGKPALEDNPLLSRDIRFFFEPNSARLDMTSTENLKNLDDIKRLLQVSPGSTILLRGHVDDTLVPQFRKQGGEAFVRKMALSAMELSRNRAAEVKQQVIAKYKIDPTRLETVGRGWEEPAGPDPEKNRRVEVQWFTVE
ncbi:MAG: NitT/TauT family transport system substrate-binding protein [Chthoniobacter sp.]|jgi:NitT/TauT family transport system substrate-binding protein|nr:NitT/TauT family transport system substrate-binding protein [Chthoniobacter sp.]